MTTKKITRDLATRKRKAVREFKRVRTTRNWTQIDGELDGRGGKRLIYDIAIGEGRLRRWYRIFKRPDQFGRKAGGEWVMCLSSIGGGSKPKSWTHWHSREANDKRPTMRAIVQSVAAYDRAMWHDRYDLDREAAREVGNEMKSGA